MNDIEQKYGKHTALVEAFLTHLESGNVDWSAANAAAGAVGGTARAAARAAAWDAARSAAVAAWDAWDAATYAAYEIIGHELLAERGKPLVFLPMFGLDIEKLKEMALEQIAESANCSNCEATKQELSDFKQKVSDALLEYYGGYHNASGEPLEHFIIPATKPDPLDRVLSMTSSLVDKETLRDRLEAEGLEIREKDE